MIVGPNSVTQPNPDKHQPNPTHQIFVAHTQPNSSTIYHKMFLRINQCPDRIKNVNKISIMVKQSNKPISSLNFKKLEQYNTIAIYFCPVGYYMYFRNQEH